MELIYFIIMVAMVLAILSFIIALKVKLEFNTDKSDINMKLFWLDPFVKIYVTYKDAKPTLKFFLFNKKIFNKTLKRGKDKLGAMELVHLSNPKDVHVDVHYGFKDPFNTGIACGAINIASHLINIDSIEQNPDFMTENDYIYLDASAKVNIGSTLIKLFKAKRE